MSALDDLLKEAQETREKEQEAAGVQKGLNQWTDSVPQGRIPSDEVRGSYLQAQEFESAASEGSLQFLIEGEPVPTDATPDGPATTIPTPGPDGEEDRPDAAGEVSQSGGGGPDGGKLETPEGMWQPPVESKAENYAPPTTAEMIRTPEWLENARALFDAIGDLTEVRGNLPIYGMPDYEEKMANQPPATDEEVIKWADKSMAGFNWNLVYTIDMAKQVFDINDPKLAMNFLNLINMYDHSDGGGHEFMRAVGMVMIDPSTYAGIGVGTMASKGAAIATTKAGLKKMAAQLATVGAVGGGVEGGAISGGFNLARQKVEVQAGAKEKVDKAELGIATGIGVGAGSLLGGGLGYLSGRHVDKLKKAFDQEMVRQLNPSTPFDDVKSAGKLTQEEFVELIEHQQRIAAMTGQEVDDQVRIAMRALTGIDEPPPRLKDGSLDMDALYEKTANIVRNNDGPVQSLERAGYKMYAGEFTDDLVFNADKMTEAQYTRIEKAAKYAGVDIEAMAVPTKEGGNEKLVMINSESKEATEKFVRKVLNDADPVQWPVPGKPAATPVSTEESIALADRLARLEGPDSKDIQIKEPGRKGTIVQNDKRKFEVIGRTKNGWFRVRDVKDHSEHNFRRNDFEVLDTPGPTKAGVLELAPFSEDSARIIHMAETISHNPLKEEKVTHFERQKMIEDLKDMGLNIEDKDLFSWWDPTTMKWLRDTYNNQAAAIHTLAKKMNSILESGGHLTDAHLAFFNQAHAKFVATRDLFYGVSGNAARTLNILRSRPKKEVYSFAQNLSESIDLHGGRQNTELAIKNMSKLRAGEEGTFGVTKNSERIWGQTTASALLNVRYNFMLSSWRTHVKNFLGNTASGVWEQMVISPLNMVVNNAAYVGRYALQFIPGVNPMSQADRLTIGTWMSEARGMFNGTRDALQLAWNVAKGAELGEGKVWNELGLRYNVNNLPDSWYGKLGTTPVRLLEAGDAFFKHQYYNSKMYGLAERRSRKEAIEEGMDFAERFQYHLDHPTTQMQKEAKDWAAKLTYTNDPSVYRGVLAGLARAAQSMQSSHPAWNLVLPFVRTPANLLGYALDMTGIGQAISPYKTFGEIVGSDPKARHEAITRLTAAAGLWMYVMDRWQAGEITGVGPTNFDERKAWEATGWQKNSIKVGDAWVSMEDIQPAGQALSTIASVMDFMALADTSKPPSEWVGIGLLSIADTIKDDSYMSTLSDLIVALDAKEEVRFRAGASSIATSMFVPNILRDIRRPKDKEQRSMASENVIDRVVKQMRNAVPGLSEGLPPSRDWKGDPKVYYGNAYVRGLIPFNMHDSTKQDAASAALAYARVPIDTPNRRLAIPGRGNFLDLMAMDKGAGFVYDKYVELLGKSRHEAINELFKTSSWKKLAAKGEIGPGSDGESYLRAAMAIGSKNGRLRMLDFLSSNDKIRRPNGNDIIIHHTFNKEEYKYIARIVRELKIEVPDDKPQYDVRNERSGPEFFKP